ncbi:hypothetical protein [Haliscomenobacter sp.]|uniref:hypothetical protein n=1 Tax=Haliscomenobacter sp. TaxID=2717303 RepID=UPI00359465D2
MDKLTHYADIIKQVITEYATTLKLVNGPITEFQLIFRLEPVARFVQTIKRN